MQAAARGVREFAPWRRFCSVKAFFEHGAGAVRSGAVDESSSSVDIRLHGKAFERPLVGTVLLLLDVEHSFSSEIRRALFLSEAEATLSWRVIFGAANHASSLLFVEPATAPPPSRPRSSSPLMAPLTMGPPQRPSLLARVVKLMFERMSDTGIRSLVVDSASGCCNDRQPG